MLALFPAPALDWELLLAASGCRTQAVLLWMIIVIMMMIILEARMIIIMMT